VRKQRKGEGEAAKRNEKAERPKIRKGSSSTAVLKSYYILKLGRKGSGEIKQKRGGEPRKRIDKNRLSRFERARKKLSK